MGEGRFDTFYIFDVSEDLPYVFALEVLRLDNIDLWKSWWKTCGKINNSLFCEIEIPTFAEYDTHIYEIQNLTKIEQN